LTGMAFRSLRAWEVRKVHDASLSLPSNQYRGFRLLVCHDHTENRRQRTFVALSGRCSDKKLAAKASRLASDIGYTLGSEVPDMMSLLNSCSRKGARFWAAGRAGRTARPDGRRQPEEEALAAVEEENTGMSDQRLFFPADGCGICVTARPCKRTWAVRVWAYGDDRRETLDTASSFASAISGTDAAAASLRSKLAAALGWAAAAAAAVFAAGAAGVVPAWAANFASVVSAAAAVSAAAVWWRSPTRRSLLLRCLPAAVKRAVRPSRRAARFGRFDRKSSVFALSENTSLGFCIDVPANSAILPDIGGVAVGMDGTGEVVRIPDADRYMGITVVGAPGSGKSTLMLNIAGGDMMRMKQGAHHTLVWFETKQDGAGRLMGLAEKAGMEPLYFVPGSDTGPQLRWLDWSDPKSASGTLTEAFVAAFDPASIQEQSRDIIAALLDMASLVWPQHLQAVGETRMNLMRTAWILAGGMRWEIAEELLEQVRRSNPDSGRYRECRERLGVYMGLSERDKDQRVAPARNKLNRLKDFPAWSLNLKRPVFTWRDVMESRRPVVVDISKFDDPAMTGYSEEMIRILLPTAIYTFWSEAQFHCSRWYDEGKSVALFCDEASNLAWNSGHILTQISTQGRSHGVSLVLGAQGWTQLSEITQMAFRNAGHKCFFQQHDSESAAALAEDFSDSSYNRNSLTRLKPFETVAVVKIGAERFGPVLLRTTDDKFWQPAEAWKEPAVL